MPNLLRTTIEINAPPSAVREKFLDFASLPTYTTFFTSITSPKPGKDLVKGDVVSVKINGGFAFNGKVETNTPQSFAWTGSLPYIFTGTHSFSWTESATTPGGTTFVQEERFSGAFAGLYGDGVVARSAGVKAKTRVGWEGFDRDLKKAVEGGK